MVYYICIVPEDLRAKAKALAQQHGFLHSESITTPTYIRFDFSGRTAHETNKPSDGTIISIWKLESKLKTMYREEHTVNWTRPEFIRPDVSSCLLQPFNAPSVTPCNSSGPGYWKNKLTRAGYKRLDELKDPALYPDVHVDEALVTRYLEEKGIKEEVETLRSALKAHEEARKLIEITAEAIQQKLEDPCTLLISSHFSVENNVEQRLRTLVARHFNEELKEKAQPEIERIEQALEALDDQLHLPRTPADERAFIEAMARLFHAEIKG